MRRTSCASAVTLDPAKMANADIAPAIFLRITFKPSCLLVD
jgi:hypothetical protein